MSFTNVIITFYSACSKKHVHCALYMLMVMVLTSLSSIHSSNVRERYQDSRNMCYRLHHLHDLKFLLNFHIVFSGILSILDNRYVTWHKTYLHIETPHMNANMVRMEDGTPLGYIRVFGEGSTLHTLVKRGHFMCVYSEMGSIGIWHLFRQNCKVNPVKWTTTLEQFSGDSLISVSIRILSSVADL